MVFMIMGVNHRFYTLVFQEVGQFLSSMSRSAVYQQAVHQVGGDSAARVEVRIATQLNLGYLSIFGSGKHVLILSEECQYIFGLAPTAASYADTEAHKAQVSRAVGVRAHD